MLLFFGILHYYITMLNNCNEVCRCPNIIIFLQRKLIIYDKKERRTEELEIVQ